MSLKQDIQNMELAKEPVLPKAESVYAVRGVVFSVYRAKDLYVKKWRHPALFKLASIARTSYRRYGSRGLFDSYDDKAAIYLVHAHYKDSKTNSAIHEWLSVRMVPGNGSFNGIGEIELYKLGNVAATKLLEKKIGESKKTFWDNIISDSRMCGIHPYTVLPHKKVAPTLTKKHRYAAESMALMQAQFMVDYPPATLPFKYVSAIVRPEIRDKVITLRKKRMEAKPAFIPAWKTLGLSRGEKLRVNRKTYSYQFPRYWLDMGKLKSLLYSLIKKGDLKPETMAHYLHGESLESDNGEIKLTHLLTAKGKLKASSLSGGELRTLIDKHVPDMPELQLIPIDIWRSSFLTILTSAKINVFKTHAELKSFLK